MGTVTERRIIDLGRGSVVITLPKPWVRFHRLQAGDTVEVVTNGKLVVRPLNRSVVRCKARKSADGHGGGADED